MSVKRRQLRAARWVSLILLLILVMTAAVSCGTTDSEESGSTESNLKLPPGATEESISETTGTASQTPQTVEGEGGEGPESAEGASPAASADLAGGRFTVVSAARPNSNDDVISSEGREIKGDYLEVELQIENAGDDLIDLSHYSFRLESPGIKADTYEDYYGGDGTFGKYVAEGVVSATLLDYSNLQPVGYRLKMGEVVDKVFLFFDLNPESTARNEEVNKDNTRLIIRKVKGSDYGEEVEINLAGYPD